MSTDVDDVRTAQHGVPESPGEGPLRPDELEPVVDVVDRTPAVQGRLALVSGWTRPY